MKLFFARLWFSPLERAEKVLAQIQAVREKITAVSKYWSNLRAETEAAEHSAYVSLDVSEIERAAVMRAKFEAVNGIYLQRATSLSTRIDAEAERHKSEIIDILNSADDLLREKQDEARAEYTKALADAGVHGVTNETPLVLALEKKREQLVCYAHSAANSQDLESGLRWLVENCA